MVSGFNYSVISLFIRGIEKDVIRWGIGLFQIKFYFIRCGVFQGEANPVCVFRETETEIFFR